MAPNKKNNPFYGDVFFPDDYFILGNDDLVDLYIEKHSGLLKNNEKLYLLQLDRIKYIESLFMMDSVEGIIEKIQFIDDIDLFLSYIHRLDIRVRFEKNYSLLCLYLATNKYTGSDPIRKKSLEYMGEELLNGYSYYVQDVFPLLETAQEVLTVLLKLDYSDIISNAMFMEYYEEYVNKYETVEDDYWKKFSRYWSVKLVDQEHVLERLFLQENYNMVIKVITYNFNRTGIVTMQAYELLLVSLYMTDPEFKREYARLGKMQRSLYETITIEEKRMIEEFVMTHLMSYRFRIVPYSLGTFYFQNPDLFLNLYVESKTDSRKKLIFDCITSYKKYNEATLNDVLTIYQLGKKYHNEADFKYTIGHLLYFTVEENCTKTNEKALTLLNDNIEMIKGFAFSMVNSMNLQYEDAKIKYGYGAFVESDLEDQMNRLNIFIDLCNIAGFFNISKECKITIKDLNNLKFEIKENASNKLNLLNDTNFYEVDYE